MLLISRSNRRRKRDKLIEVTDEDLIQELSDVVADIYDKINDDDDED